MNICVIDSYWQNICIKHALQAVFRGGSIRANIMSTATPSFEPRERLYSLSVSIPYSDEEQCGYFTPLSRHSVKHTELGNHPGACVHLGIYFMYPVSNGPAWDFPCGSVDSWLIGTSRHPSRSPYRSVMVA